MRVSRLLLPAALLIASAAFSQQDVSKLYPVEFADVKVTDPFWKERMDKVATRTLEACILYTETKTGRIRNFENAARRSGKHEGIYFDDSDVYKAIEAMAYSLRTHPDSAIAGKADEWIDMIAAAQLPDGYLNTYYTLTGLNKRWTDMEKHEDYCAGHLIEAAVAYHSATGKRKLLDVAIRFADHIDSTFRLANRHWVSGHQEIELALMRLYHHTGNDRYLKLAQWYLEQRGHGYGKGVIWDDWKDPDYCQDAIPIKDQQQITGHAVRAMYLYTGAADVAAATNDSGYIHAMKMIWNDVIGRNMYITGGIGAQGKNEGFGTDFDLPNESAYCETCASVGMVFWNQRMNRLTGDAKFADVMERSLYNGALDGLSRSGDHFFYGNPLASTGNYERSEWFGTACCPSNIARLVASIGNYIYTTSADGIWVNLFIGSGVALPVGKKNFSLAMQTGYPWNGDTKIRVADAPSKPMTIRLRIPGWLHEPAPGGLYTYTDSANAQLPILAINGREIIYHHENGYIVITRKWKKGDAIDFKTPMRVREAVSRSELKQDSGRVALQYGPMVYCVEGVDNAGNAYNFIVPPEPGFEVKFQGELLGGVNTIKFRGNAVSVSGDARSVAMAAKTITAIPYYSWNNRGASTMQVWLPTGINEVRINP